MKVIIGKYIPWFGTYQLAEKLMFWKDKDSSEVYKFGTFLTHGSTKEPDWTFNQLNEERETTWLFKILEWVYNKRERKVRVYIDPYDTWNLDNTLAHIIHPALVEFKNRATGYPNGLSEEEWNKILDKMIYSFNCLIEDEDNLNLSVRERKQKEKKIQNGLELFGKHYRNLWD